MKTPLLIAYLGNFIDMVSTLYLYGLGYTEINPIMAPLLRFPAVFAVVKLFAMGCALHILWRNRAHRAAHWLAWLAAAVYGAISIYYGVFFTLWA